MTTKVSKRVTNAAFAATFVLCGLFSNSVLAQEPAAEHLSAARKALSATRATESFDSILINTANGLKNQLTANEPDKADQIATIVDDEAIALAGRRGDLEGEAARLFANNFTAEELGNIAAFFNSEVGKKYLSNAPLLARELEKLARVWANGIARDLSGNVVKKMAPASE